MIRGQFCPDWCALVDHPDGPFCHRSARLSFGAPTRHVGRGQITVWLRQYRSGVKAGPVWLGVHTAHMAPGATVELTLEQAAAFHEGMAALLDVACAG